MTTKAYTQTMTKSTLTADAFPTVELNVQIQTFNLHSNTLFLVASTTLCPIEIMAKKSTGQDF